MERIASFCVDHTKLDRGMYISRIDGDVVTYDIRMKKPNGGDYLAVPAAHTIEHLFATYARKLSIRQSSGVRWADGMPHRLLFIGARHRFA